MTRYTRHLTVAVPATDLYQQLIETLESCKLNIIHTSEDYLMARETPGGIPFTQLVTIEILIDNTRATDTNVQLTMVVKNEELPLKANNHCFQMYNTVSQAFADNRKWKLLQSLTGI